jgi:hypothetical protein
MAEMGRQRVDLRDQDDRVAQHHAEQRQRAQHRDEAERDAEQRHDQRHADQRQRPGRQHHQHPLHILELEHQQDDDHEDGEWHCGHVAFWLMLLCSSEPPLTSDAPGGSARRIAAICGSIRFARSPARPRHRRRW